MYVGIALMMLGGTRVCEVYMWRSVVARGRPQSLVLSPCGGIDVSAAAAATLISSSLAVAVSHPWEIAV